jgi:phospholipid/cholesterol/gamma-HCH transport system permease protein
MAAAYDIHDEGRERVLALKGDWTIWTIADLDAPLRALSARLGPGLVLDVSALGRLDVAGAYLIDRTVRGGSPCANTDAPITVRGAHPAAERLLRTARASTQPCPAKSAAPNGLLALMDSAGRGLASAWREAVANLAFFGEALAVLAGLLLRPGRIRWTSVVHVMEHAGLRALPIICVLSFFVGVVIAYLGARVSSDFGLSIFTVELVAYSMFREFGVVITAVLLAGRTDSAFTAEIGAMKMRQEIDALRVLGLSPMEVLVAPRLIAMLIMMPFLTFLATVAGIFGGMLICWAEIGVTPGMFFSRVQENIPDQHFWVGMFKAPFFAVVLALIGCRHGLEVGSDVASLGQRTTASVVQSIFIVIVMDALFAIWFLEMDW